MPKLPKHLREMDPSNVERLKKGFMRFRFGFAEPGEIQEFDGGNGGKAVFIGDYGVKREAQRVATEQGGKVNPYLFGHRKTGWSVYKLLPKEG